MHLTKNGSLNFRIGNSGTGNEGMAISDSNVWLEYDFGFNSAIGSPQVHKFFVLCSSQLKVMKIVRFQFSIYCSHINHLPFERLAIQICSA